jgi:hypothetical protein
MIFLTFMLIGIKFLQLNRGDTHSYTYILYVFIWLSWYRYEVSIDINDD